MMYLYPRTFRLHSSGQSEETRQSPAKIHNHLQVTGRPFHIQLDRKPAGARLELKPTTLVRGSWVINANEPLRALTTIKGREVTSAESGTDMSSGEGSGSTLCFLTILRKVQIQVHRSLYKLNEK